MVGKVGEEEDVLMEGARTEMTMQFLSQARCVCVLRL